MDVKGDGTHGAGGKMLSFEDPHTGKSLMLPYSIFHSLDSSLKMPTCPKNGEKISVETNHFNDKTTTLSYAWNRYMDKNNSSVWVDSLKYTSPKIVWENE